MSRLSEAIGIRLSVLLGTVTMGVMVLIASFADQLWQFYAIFFIGSFIGGGSLFAPMVANASRWFKTGVGLAIGVVSGGQALGKGWSPISAARRSASSGGATRFCGWAFRCWRRCRC